VEGAGAKNGRTYFDARGWERACFEGIQRSYLGRRWITSNGKGMENDVRSALEFRIGVKMALKKLRHGLILALKNKLFENKINNSKESIVK
jgi:hypothetical protein